MGLAQKVVEVEEILAIAKKHGGTLLHVSGTYIETNYRHMKNLNRDNHVIKTVKTKSVKISVNVEMLKIGILNVEMLNVGIGKKLGLLKKQIALKELSRQDEKALMKSTDIGGS